MKIDIAKPNTVVLRIIVLLIIIFLFVEQSTRGSDDSPQTSPSQIKPVDNLGNPETTTVRKGVLGMVKRELYIPSPGPGKAEKQPP